MIGTTVADALHLIADMADDLRRASCVEHRTETMRFANRTRYDALELLKRVDESERKPAPWTHGGARSDRTPTGDGL